MSEIQTATSQDSNPLAMVRLAIEQGMDPQKLQGLMDLAERWEKNRAAERFANALTAFQAESGPVVKARVAKIHSSKGEFGYAFASLDDIDREIRDMLVKHSIVVTYKTRPSPGPGLATVVCVVRVGIHVEETEFTLPIPQMTVNDTQKYGGWLTYAKRYALCAALNIVTTDKDDDGATAFDTITADQVREIEGILKAKKIDRDKFCGWLLTECKTRNISQIPALDYAKVMRVLQNHQGGSK